MEETKQITKDQHYVPQFYLNRFVNSEGKLEILDCDLRKIVKSRVPKSVCNEEFFYSLNNKADEVSQVIESEFKKIENYISKEYDLLVAKIIGCKQITNEDKRVLSDFLSSQYLRGNYMRKQTKKMEEQMVKMVTRFNFNSPHIESFFDKYEKDTGEKISEEKRKEVIQFAQDGNYSVEMGNSTHLSLLGELSGFSNLFFAKEWLIYISASSKKFITSDNPITELFPDWTDKFFYGPDFLQRIHHFSMTPEILIVMTDPKNPPEIGKIKRKTLFGSKESNQKILELNFEYVRHALSYAYSNNKAFLEDILNSSNLYNKNKENFLKNIIKRKQY